MTFRDLIAEPLVKDNFNAFGDVIETPDGARTQLLTDRAVFTEAHAVIPKGSFTETVTSLLPFWDKARFWVLARPLTGFAETFSHYIGEVERGGGSTRPDTCTGAQSVLFVVGGKVSITISRRAPIGR